MKKTIKFKHHSIDCACNALTPILYREIFQRDFLTQLMSFTKVKAYDKIKDLNGSDEAKKKAVASILDEDDVVEIMRRSQIVSEITFVYAKQAEIEDVNKLMNLSKVDYYGWLAGFDNGTFRDSDGFTSVIELWNSNTESTTESKNA